MTNRRPCDGSMSSDEQYVHRCAQKGLFSPLCASGINLTVVGRREVSLTVVGRGGRCLSPLCTSWITLFSPLCTSWITLFSPLWQEYSSHRCGRSTLLTVVHTRVVYLSPLYIPGWYISHRCGSRRDTSRRCGSRRDTSHRCTYPGRESTPLLYPGRESTPLLYPG